MLNANYIIIFAIANKLINIVVEAVCLYKIKNKNISYFFRYFRINLILM